MNQSILLILHIIWLKKCQFNHFTSNQMKNHIENEKISIENISKDLETLAKDLDHKHRQQRKIQFLLDIRGYFVANKIIGSYVEFGLYRGEMMFSAHHILENTGCILNYIGLDTFSGEPPYSIEEQKVNPFLKPDDFKTRLSKVETMN